MASLNHLGDSACRARCPRLSWRMKFWLRRGQVRALFVIAGNPILAWPDQEKTLKAMQSLDLLVCIDPYMAATAELAHYVLPPKLTLEREDVTLYQTLGTRSPIASTAKPSCKPIMT